jgi:hypothetical protein
VTWEEQYHRWVKARDNNPYDDRPARIVVVETAKSARNGATLDTSNEWAWVESALDDADRRSFVSAVFHRQAAPSGLASMLLTRGIEERNPSTNRLLIEPAVKAMGALRVMRRLLDLLRDGSDDEKAGAASAAYWVQGDLNERKYAEARTQFRDELLRQFVDTENDFVRQRIIPSLSMMAEDYSPDVTHLIPVAIGIARAHSDPYIRQRIEVQLGSERTFRALPR